MLKFTYAETGLHIEHSVQSVSEWIELRIRLSRQVSHQLRLERCVASFLLPAALIDSTVLHDVVRSERYGVMEWAIADAECIEITLTGIWLSSSHSDIEGVFVIELSDRTEGIIIKLWQKSQLHISALQG
ncbi:MAG: alr0857 family protein [Elainellaceae cyanobacterium]